MGRAASGCFCLDLGASAWSLGGLARVGRGIVVYRRRANSCEVSRMVGQEARKRSMAGCQGWEHIEPCLKPGHAPSTGAERGWVKGYKKGGRTIKKRRHVDTSRGADWMDHYNPVFVLDGKLFAIVKLKGEKTASEAISFRGSREGVICLLWVS